MGVKMKTTKTVQKEVEVIEDIICNKCGNSCYSGFSYEGLIEANIIGGYGSKSIGDMEHYCFSMCEDCLMELFKTFKHNPYVSETNFG